MYRLIYNYILIIPLRLVRQLVFNLKPYALEGPGNSLNLTVHGDWTSSENLTNREAIFTALEPILFKATNHHIVFNQQTVEREVMVVSGNRFSPPPGTPIPLYAEKSEAGGYDGYGNLNDLLNSIGERLGIRFVNETGIKPDAREVRALMWVNHPDSFVSPSSNRRVQMVDEALKHLADQTGLTFTRERRPVPVWFVSEQH